MTMRTPSPTANLNELHALAERISANLVDLELDSSRQLLEASALTGRSAERWAAASAAVTELWRRRGLLEALLERADKLNSPRRAGELHALLEGPCIELSNGDVPIDQRQLLGAARTDERCTPKQLLAEMSAAFDEVKAAIAALAGAWERLLPQLESVRLQLAETVGLAADLDERRPPELERAAQTLERLGEAITADPLAVGPGDIEALRDTIQALRDELAASVALKHGFEGRMLAVRQLIGRVQAARAESREAREELLRKMAGPVAVPPLVGDNDERLEAELTAIAQRATGGDWRGARRALDALTARAESLLHEAHRSRDASRAPIEARNQFRGLLEAYRVKAARLGRAEDAQLTRILAQAERALYTAPTDLALAAQLVRSYQEALSESPPTREANR
jgi:hypothetical protein